MSAINEHKGRLTFTPFLPTFLDFEGADELFVLAAFVGRVLEPESGDDRLAVESN